MSDVAAIAHAISAATGRRFEPTNARPAGGGCINRALVLGDSDQRYFVKLNTVARADMFRAEADGLTELHNAGAVRVPTPICTGTADEAFLVLEYLELGSDRGAGQERLGQGLAALHRHTQPAFGWQRDNTIGSTLQPNRVCPDWVEFWRVQRLNHQLALAGRTGYARELADRGAALSARLGEFFTDYRPVPSLLHGDLWSGNYGVVGNSEPVIYDPAVYYGDRETDIAMTEFFGGFGHRFYAAYDAAWPLDSGYAVRKNLYNLYHVLNHLNLFGGSYLGQATRLIDQLLSEVR